MADDRRRERDDPYWEGGRPYEPYAAAGGGRWYTGETPYGDKYEESESGHSWARFAHEPIRERTDRVAATGDFRPYGDDVFEAGRGDYMAHGQSPGRALPYGALYGRNLEGWGHHRNTYYSTPRYDWPEYVPPDAGRHVGRGPRGYRRRDESIHDEVCEHLTRAGWVDASDITVRVEDGEVTLEGTVDDRAEKRAAENLAWAALGVHDVHNRLRRRRGRTGREDEGESDET